MDKLTLRQLRYFESLARHGHFGHAAAAASVSQPALSVQIRDLEATLGTALFERGPRHVRLTAFGEAFAERVRGILRRVDELGELARAAQNRLAGRLRLGVIPTIAPYLLPRIVADLRDRHPDLDLQVRETLTGTLVAELRDGRLDAAIVALPVSEPRLEETELFEEEFLLVRPAAKADAPAPDAAALLGENLLLLEEGHCFRDQALAFCGTGGRARAQDGLDGSSLSTLVQMVGAGLGVTLIPAMAEPVEARAAPVSVARFAPPAPSRRVGIVWRRTSPMAGPLSDLAEAVRRAALTASEA